MLAHTARHILTHHRISLMRDVLISMRLVILPIILSAIIHLSNRSIQTVIFESELIYEIISRVLDFEWHPPDVVADFVHIIHHPIVFVLLQIIDALQKFTHIAVQRLRVVESIGSWLEFDEQAAESPVIGKHYLIVLEVPLLDLLAYEAIHEF